MIRHRLKWGAVPLLAAAMLAAGCTKEATVPGLQIFEEGMVSGNGSKVQVDPNNPTHNSWSNTSLPIYVHSSAGSSSCYISETSGSFYIDYNPTSEFVACYPDYAVYNPTPTSVSIGYIYPAILYPNGYNHSEQVHLPMIAFGDENSNTMTFQHATGAIAFNIVNNTTDKYVAKVTITNDIGVWPGSGESLAKLNCSKGSDGNLVVSFDGGTKLTSWYWDIRQNGDPVHLPPHGSMYIVLPVPETTGTQFTVSVNAKNRNWYSGGTDPVTGHYIPAGWRYDDNYVTKTINNLTIQRNHILRLPNFEIN